jgi:cytochrome b subunit of formate dehydrogenase
MDDKDKLKNQINEEVEKRLKEKITELESQIREEVRQEYTQKQEEPKLEEPKPEEQKLEEQKVPVEDVKKEEKKEKEYFIRFGLNFRIQHISLMISTIMLILTGVPLKFPKNGVSQFIMSGFGGVEGARSVHHLFALGLILVGIYHLFYTFWFKEGRKDFFEFLPSPKDFSNLINQIKFYLGIRKKRVKYGRFSYVEKFDYWAVYWGLIMMIGTGAVMWLFQGKFEPLLLGEISLPFGPTIITNSVHAIAREMHSDEALLATLVIIGWHFYNVHLNPHKFPMSKVWLNGKISKKEIQEEHPLEYIEIMRKRKQEEEEADAETEE